MKNKKLKAFLLTVCLALLTTMTSYAEEIHLKNAEDLLMLSENCVLDSWSLGKTVVLDNDISLSGSGFVSIPSFSGTFNGNGHTISGCTYDSPYSPLGFIGVLTKEGTVNDLKIEGSMNVQSDADICGGIVGKNYGTINRSTFSGSISADTDVGGICGSNEKGGRIEAGEAYGTILGNSMTGGITGSNAGTVRNCINYSSVNTVLLNKDTGIEDLDLSNIYLLGRKNPDSISASSDTGGIAGYSLGEITGCENRQTIGYPRTGYNCGGIAGRSCGLIEGCINSGTIYARKDAGGIAGQAEPDIVISPSEYSLSNIQNELHTLRDMLNDTLNDYDDKTGEISACFEELNNGMDSADLSAKALADSAEAYYNEGIDELNRVSGIVDESISLLTDVTRELTYASSEFNTAVSDLGAAEAQYNTSYNGSSASADLKKASSDVTEASEKIKIGSEQIEAAVRKSAGEDIRITTSSDAIKSTAGEIAEGLKSITEGLKLITDASEKLESSIDKFDDHVKPYIRRSLNEMEDGCDHLNSAISNADFLTDYLNEQDKVELKPVSEDINDSAKALHDSLTDIGNRLDALNEVTKNSSDDISEDLRKVNDQLIRVLDLVAGIDASVEDSGLQMHDSSLIGVEEQKLGKISSCENSGQIIADINVGGIAGAMGMELGSDREGNTADYSEAFANLYELKLLVLDCENDGNVTAQKNYSGGICGRMDLGLLRGCRAYGSAASENGSYIGGIAGVCSGSVQKSYAMLRLSGSKYVGGIIGSAQEVTTVDSDCRVYDCYSLVNVERCNQFSGAVSGNAEGEFKRNYFVSDELAGINGISYSGKAEPISYELLTAKKDVPDAFRSFHLRFIADENVIKEMTFNYGESFSSEVYPDIPKVEGFNAQWDRDELTELKFNTDVSVIYTPYVTALESEELRDEKRPLFYVSGSFSGEQKLTVSPGNSFSSDKLIEEWNVIIPDDGNTAHQVRFQPGINLKLIDIYLNEGDGWKKLSSETIGSYECFNVGSNVISIAVLYKTSLKVIIIAAAGTAVFLLITGFIIIRIRKKKKAGKKRKETEEKA